MMEIEIEVTVSMKDLQKLTAEVAEMVEETRAKMLRGEIEPEPDTPSCDCPGWYSAPWTRDPVHRKAERWHRRKLRTAL